MSKNTSLRARLKAMEIGELVVVPKAEYSPSVVQSTAYRIKNDALDGRRYTTRLLDEAVEVSRIA